nr:unnamed protein product [Callosobruchus chinensis]
MSKKFSNRGAELLNSYRKYRFVSVVAEPSIASLDLLVSTTISYSFVCDMIFIRAPKNGATVGGDRK